MPLPLPMQLPSRRFSSSAAAASSVPINSLDFPHLRIDPAAPRTFGRDYEHGRDVRDAPVLVLHGLLGSAINWRTTAPKLTQRRRLLSLDVRNHGASPHTDDMRFASCAADVIALMDAKKIKHAVLLGHSLGGKIAMACALLHPERIAAVVSVDMAPFRYEMGAEGWKGVRHIVAAAASVPLEEMRSRADVDAFLKPLIADFTTRAFVLQSIVVDTTTDANGERVQTVRWRCNLPALAAALPSMAEFDPRLPSGAAPAPFKGPALFVGGGRSSYLTKHQQPAVLHYFPRATNATVDAGHWVHVEKPAEFVAIVQPWLEKLEALDAHSH